MKKVIYFATAAAVAMSSFATVVSASSPTYSYYEGEGHYATDDQGLFGIPHKDKVTVELDMQSKLASAEDSSYSSHTTTLSPLSQTYTSETPAMTFDARALLDMSNVAKQWKAYIDKAKEFGTENTQLDEDAMETVIMNSTTLDGTFTIVITVPDEIENDALLNENKFSWPDNAKGYSVTDFFEQDTAPSYTEADGMVTYTLKMKVSDGKNDEFNKYFKSLNDDLAAAADEAAAEQTSEDYSLIFCVEDSVLSTTGTYEINGEFSGSVTISVKTAATALDDDFVVMFGNDDDYTSFEGVEPAEDTEYVRLATQSLPGEPPSGGGGGGGGTGPTRTQAPSTSATPDPDATATPGATSAPGETQAPSASHTPAPVVTDGPSSGAQLNYEDHYAYIIGYDVENGPSEVRPENNITRAEVATIFFRMLTDESRAQFWSKTNSYSDVSADDWFNNAISTASEAGIVNGYDTGDFRPNAPITRAEFAAIAARFSSRDYTGEDMFSDISGHWAAESINEAASIGWITGYENGTFRPDQNITRAEAMTLINRVLYRLVDNDGVGSLSDMVTWPDNTPDKWYYAAVQEATNSHYYTRETIGHYETWTEIREPRDWAALETALSQVTDAGEEESIFFDETDVPSASPAPEQSEEPSESPEPDSSEEPSASPEPDASESPAPEEE